jgi:DNA-binding FadR family transcriptional regulator
MPQSIRSGSAARAAVFSPLEGAGRAELVTQRLTDAIVLGVLHDGERLPSESTLAGLLGVATVTAREALETLRDRGLVRTKRGRDGGSFVTHSGDGHDLLRDERLRGISRVELRDCGVHYTAIAAMAAELAADRATADDVGLLRRIVESTDAASEHACRRGQGTFSLEVAALSQSARLVREELRLQAEFGPLLWLCLRDQDYRDRCLLLQGAIVKAIESTDAETARSLTEQHVALRIDWLIDTKSELEMRE